MVQRMQQAGHAYLSENVAITQAHSTNAVNCGSKGLQCYHQEILLRGRRGFTTRNTVWDLQSLLMQGTASTASMPITQPFTMSVVGVVDV